MTMLLRITASLILVAVAWLSIAIRPDAVTRTESITTSAGDTVRVHSSESTARLPRVLDLVALGALILAAWQWRRQLGVSQLGPLAGPSSELAQEPAGGPPKPEEDSEPPGDALGTVATASSSDPEERMRIEHTLSLFRKTHAVNTSYLARELGVTPEAARKLLFDLADRGVLRIDGFPKSTIFTLARSVENRILDAVRAEVAASDEVVSERRFVRTPDGREVDMVVETGSQTVVVEAKIIREPAALRLAQLQTWIDRLGAAAAKLPGARTVAVLALGCTSQEAYEIARERVASLTMAGSRVPMRITALGPDELGP